jgi:hypothetical protein
VPLLRDSFDRVSAVRCGVAQWLGQFSGHTHATKVEDAEKALQHAVSVFRTAAPHDRASKAKSVRGLAERAFSARLKLLKARIASLEPLAERGKQNSNGIESLRTKEEQLRADGVNSILIEFNALDALS